MKVDKEIGARVRRKRATMRERERVWDNNSEKPFPRSAHTTAVGSRLILALLQTTTTTTTTSAIWPRTGGSGGDLVEYYNYYC